MNKGWPTSAVGVALVTAPERLAGFKRQARTLSVNGGSSWAAIHQGVPEGAGNFQFIHPFAMDPGNSSRLWYGGATAFRSDNRSSIAVDPSEPLIAYATYSTYNFGTHLGHVFKTIDGGTTWTRIDKTLPDMPVHSVVVHPSQPNTLYIGSDLGVFVTTDGGGAWMRENTGFANVVTEHLEVNNGRLFAFTHGRSVWSIELE